MISHPQPVFDPFASTTWIRYFYDQFACYTHAGWTHNNHVGGHLPLRNLWAALVLGTECSDMGFTIPGIHLRGRHQFHTQMDSLWHHDSLLGLP